MINRAFDSYGNSRYSSINEQDELNLVLKAQNGDGGALEELLDLKQHVVEKVALEFAYSPMTNAELLELGEKTLIKSIRIFDPNRGTKFGSFAYWGMKQAFQKATNNATALKADSKSSRFSVFGEALDAAVSKRHLEGNKQTEQPIEGNKQTERATKTEDTRRFFVTKHLDWSTLNHGLTIPVNKIDTFVEHLSFVPQKGKMYPVTVILDGKDYQVQMIDVKFTDLKRSRVVQIRYTPISPIANALQIKFQPAYQQLAKDHQNFAGIDTYVSLVNGKRRDCFSLEFSGEKTILGQGDFPDKVVDVQASSFSLADETPQITHTRPSCFIFQGQECALTSWTDFIIKIGKLVYSCEHGDLLREVEPSAIEFTGRQCIGKDVTGMLAPKLIGDNLWIETNFNAKQLVAFAKWMLWWCDIDQSKVVVRYQSKSAAVQTVGVPKNRERQRSSRTVSQDQPQLTAFSAEDVLKIKTSGEFESLSLENVNSQSLGFTTPILLDFNGTPFAVTSWKKVLTTLVEFLAQSPVYLQRLKSGVEMLPFTDRVVLVDKPGQLRVPHQLTDDLYLETNYSSNYCVLIASELAKYAGINFNETPCTIYYVAKKELVMKNKPGAIVSGHVPSFTREFAVQCSQILNEYFSRGIRKNSIIDRNKFGRKYEEVFGIPLSEDDATHLWDACTSKGITVEDKIFPLTKEASDLVSKLTDIIINNGARQVYYSSFYEENQKNFFETGIGSADILAGILRSLYPTYEHCEHFFRIDRSVSAEDEVVRVLSNGHSLTVEGIQEQLEGLPQERIVQVCRSSTKIVKNGVKYTLIDSIRFDEDEVLQASSKIETCIQQQEYALLRESSLDNSEALNFDVCQEALQRAMFQKYLSRDYAINRGIISAKGASLSVSLVLKAFCEDQSQFTLSEIENLSQELNGYASNQGLAIAQKVAVQIDAEHFIKKNLLDFDIKAIDDALDELIPDNMLSLQGIHSFITLPAVSGYSWTQQLLASYCRLVSRTFSLMEATASNVCNGIIIRKSVACASYYQASAMMAVRDNISLEYEAVENYAVRKGLLARRRPSAVTSILNEMKQLSGDN